jgi:hypothetical protein
LDAQNQLGGIMALGVAVCQAPRSSNLSAANSGSSLRSAPVLVILSTSNSSAGVGARTCHRRRHGDAPWFAADRPGLRFDARRIILGAAIILLAPDLVVALLGDSRSPAAPRLGRRRFISAALARLRLYAFWLPENGPAYWVRQAVASQVASAHSAGELALDLGRIGCLLRFSCSQRWAAALCDVLWPLGMAFSPRSRSTLPRAARYGRTICSGRFTSPSRRDSRLMRERRRASAVLILGIDPASIVAAGSNP